MHIQSNVHNMTIFMRPCGDLRSRCVFLCSQFPKSGNKLSLVTETSIRLGQNNDTACDVLPSSISKYYLHDKHHTTRMRIFENYSHQGYL